MHIHVCSCEMDIHSNVQHSIYFIFIKYSRTSSILFNLHYQKSPCVVVFSSIIRHSLDAPSSGRSIGLDSERAVGREARANPSCLPIRLFGWVGLAASDREEWRRSGSGAACVSTASDVQSMSILSFIFSLCLLHPFVYLFVCSIFGQKRTCLCICVPTRSSSPRPIRG